MKSIEVSGKTVEEAVQRGLEQLGLARDAVEMEILSEPSAGFLGLIGTKQAVVRLTEKIIPDNFLKDFMESLLSRMGLSGQAEIVVDEDMIRVNVSGEKMGMLIGKRGQTLNALQYLLNVIYRKKFPGERQRIILDAEDYRQKREKTLKELAERVARKVSMYKKEVMLEPMNPQERRIIHTALQGHPAVDTYSQGDEPYRKVVIAPK